MLNKMNKCMVTGQQMVLVCLFINLLVQIWAQKHYYATIALLFKLASTYVASWNFLERLWKNHGNIMEFYFGKSVGTLSIRLRTVWWLNISWPIQADKLRAWIYYSVRLNSGFLYMNDCPWLWHIYQAWHRPATNHIDSIGCHDLPPNDVIWKTIAYE